MAIRGTGAMIWKRVGKPLAGKTGTTNEEKDAWFIGFSPDLAMGVFIGYDNPQPMGHGETGGELAAPIFADFFKLALKDKPAVPFRTPPDIRQVRVNRRTGQRTDPNDPDAITEYFKPGTEPGDGYATAADYSSKNSLIAMADGGRRTPGPWGAPPQPRPPSDGALSAALWPRAARRRLVLTRAGIIFTQLNNKYHVHGLTGAGTRRSGP